jgi:hypothetical protein
MFGNRTFSCALMKILLRTVSKIPNIHRIPLHVFIDVSIDVFSLIDDDLTNLIHKHILC